jgi:hypothetical protein
VNLDVGHLLAIAAIIRAAARLVDSLRQKRKKRPGRSRSASRRPK